MKKITLDGKNYLGKIVGSSLIGLSSDEGMDDNRFPSFAEYLADEHKGELEKITFGVDSVIKHHKFTEEEDIKIKTLKKYLELSIKKAQKNMETTYFLTQYRRNN